MDRPVSQNLNILLAEDDTGHATLVKKNLWRVCVDAEVFHFSDGQELLSFLEGKSTIPETFTHGKYVLLLDIKMQGINGIDVLRTMKKHPEFGKIPVVMLTTTSDPREINLCYAEGCSFYIVKPSDYIKFMEAIESLGNFLSLSTLEVPDIEPPASQK